MEKIDISHSITINNLNKYTACSRGNREIVLCATPIQDSKSLFRHLGSPTAIWIYQGEIYPVHPATNCTTLNAADSLQVIVQNG